MAGVPAEDRERIFERLVRLKTACDGNSAGAGLGLTIARGIARAHGGDVTCQPPPAGSIGGVFVAIAVVSCGPVATSPAGGSLRQIHPSKTRRGAGNVYRAAVDDVYSNHDDQGCVRDS